MINKVISYIKKHKLILPNQHIIIGVSGGADSICLFHILKSLQKEYSLKLTVAHINHGMRLEAKDDALFVEELCKRWEIPYQEHRCDILALAKEGKCSEEEAGRNERYKFFEATRIKYQADLIAVAHTMNDQAETMLMRLVRGSGLTGLGAMMTKRDHIIRPILILSREEVEAYCEENRLLYKEDQTNKMNIYTRNRLRLEVLPMLREHFNPRIIQTMAQTASQLQETEDYLSIETQKAYEEVVTKYKNRYCLEINSLLAFHVVIQSRVIRMVIEKAAGSLRNISYQHISDILDLPNKQSGKRLDIGRDLIAIREHKYITIIQNQNTPAYCYNLELGINEIIECNKRIGLILEHNSKNVQRYENTYTKNIDYDKIDGSLQIRNRRAGDRILLKNGSKKLKDFFIDEKIPKTCRDDIIVIADQSNVIWIVGYRLSEAYYITDKTERVLQIQVRD